MIACPSIHMPRCSQSLINLFIFHHIEAFSKPHNPVFAMQVYFAQSWLSLDINTLITNDWHPYGCCDCTGAGMADAGVRLCRVFQASVCCGSVAAAAGALHPLVADGEADSGRRRRRRQEQGGQLQLRRYSHRQRQQQRQLGPAQRQLGSESHY